MRWFFTADTHFGHANIIKHCNRPFTSVGQMDTTLIAQWNQRVKKEDIVFHLGDFCFRNTLNRGEGEIHKSKYYLEQLNGNVILLQGNHDKNNTTKTCIKGIQIELGGHSIYLTHNPRDARKDVDLNLVGHVHGNWKDADGSLTILNVGVDVWDFKPILIEEILKHLSKKKGRGKNVKLSM